MNGSAEVGIVVQAINKMVDTLSERIVKTETDVAAQIMRMGAEQLSHQKNVEARLDQLIEITKEVAVMRTEASHRDDRIETLTKLVKKLEDDSRDSVKRIHLKIDDTEKHHDDLNERFKKAFYIGSGMWLFAMGWFYIYNPVKNIDKIASSFEQLKEDVRDLKDWQWKLQQATPIERARK